MDKPRYSFSPGPPPDVSSFLKNKGLRRSFSWADMEPEEHAVAFAVAKGMQVDVLTTIKDELQRAIDEGRTFAQFKKDLKPKLKKRGWWGWKEQIDPINGEVKKVKLGTPRRLKTIYQANLRSARAAGQWQRIQRSKKVLPYLMYLLGPSERHRPQHEAKSGLVLPIDDPFWNQWYPPNGWGCKCHVRQISAREAEERGISDSPPIAMRDWKNHRTGEIKKIPSGIDPGWEKNPALLRQQYTESLLSEKLNAADPAIAHAAARDIVMSWRVARILDGSATGSTPVAMLSDRLSDALGSKTRTVLLSSDTASKQLRNHPEVKQSDYLHLADLIERGEARIAQQKNLILIEGRDLPWLAVIKKTKNRSELYLTTLYRSGSGRYIKRLKKRSVLIE